MRILIVEDNANDAELMIEELRRVSIKFECERVDTEADTSKAN